MSLARITVLYGGNSAEREVSLQSGQAVAQALSDSGYQVSLLDAKGDYWQQLLQEQPDLVFLALHGRGGEDGEVQGLLQQLGLPYTGSGVCASALCMDKVLTKQLLLANDLPTAEFRVLLQGQSIDVEAIIEHLGLPIFVKPAQEGSSIGMSKVSQPEQLLPAIELAFKYDTKLMLEAFLPGKEYTVAMVDGQALPVIGVKPAAEFYDYQSKYVSDQTQYLLPSGLPAELESKAKVLAESIFKCFAIQGWCRVDMMLDSKEQLQVLEINTVPGMTSHSLVPMAAHAQGWSFSDLVCRIAELGFAKGKR